MKKIFIGVIVSLLAFTGCKDYLDIVPREDIQTLDDIFQTRTGAFQWMVDCHKIYEDLVYGEHSNMAILGADEYAGGQRLRDRYAAFLIADGDQNVMQPYDNRWTTSGIWHLIRKCNTFLEYIDKTSNLKDGELGEFTGIVKALKAFYYFELIKRYGPIAIVDENLEVWESSENLRQARQHIDTCFNEVVHLLDEASVLLPKQKDKKESMYSYFSQEAAKALRVRVLLYAASPLYNGNGAFYKDFRNMKGEPLFETEYDAEKWRKAAEAADQLLSELVAEGYELISGSDNQDSKLRNVIRDVELSIWAPGYKSTEAIHVVDGRNTLWVNQIPMLGTTGNTSDENGDTHWGSYFKGDLAANMKMVEMFYSSNGVPIDEDINWDYNRRYQMGRESDVNYQNIIPLNEDVLRLHLRREPRFYACIAAPGTYWQMGPDPAISSDRTMKGDIVLVQSYRGQRFGLKERTINPDYPQNLTGYWVKKGTRSELATSEYLAGLNRLNIHETVNIRLAELYLISAEAWLEYDKGPGGAHSMRIFECLNKIRERAGLLGVKESWSRYSKKPNKVNTYEGMQEIVRQERAIELMYEGHRFWDLRRWKTAHLELNDKPKGWNVLAETKREFYNSYREPEVMWGRAQFLAPRDYLWPLKSEEVMISGNVQNPGW
ncbi:RagB/SusD family nutrient uptake outer membrane protein [Butyricimonas sp. Marseille-P3923]|uniref:RagB/SusD family nutrient uptake outer membrane protein n=1 Tax=Butyricimonas sp. Marseille-P3923 TaxID=1987504 RepID=UPI000C083E96|nr:RagB/SusD family nutrient uptake outer membrane protein [Butyricimonas sp. Marseille-P3923]